MGFTVIGQRHSMQTKAEDVQFNGDRCCIPREQMHHFSIP